MNSIKVPVRRLTEACDRPQTGTLQVQRVSMTTPGASASIGNSLIGLIGAGIGVAAAGMIADLPPGMISSGEAIVRRLVRADVPGIHGYVEGAVAAVWTAAKADNIPIREMVRHAAALPSLMDRDRLADDELAVALAEAQAIHRHGGVPRIVADRLADGLVARWEAGGLLVAAGLNAAVTDILLEGLFLGLLSGPRTLVATRACLGELAETLRSRVDADGASPAGGPMPDATYVSEARRDVSGLVEAARHIGTATGLAQAALEALVRAGHERGLRDSEILRGMDDAVVDMLELMGDVAAAASEVGDDGVLETCLAAALESLRRGMFSEARRHLDDAARHGERSAVAGVRNERRSAPGRILILQARLGELRGDWLDAADAYDAAARIHDPVDRLGCWRLLIRKAAAQVRHGAGCNDVNALHDAVETHTIAGRMVTESAAPLEWAEANAALGEALLLLGELEGKPERYLAAALHFRPALEVFSREKASEPWAKAQLGLADALRGQGSFQGDVVILGEAVFAYRAALGVLSKERALREWLRAEVRYGSTLVRLGEESGEEARIAEALSPLRTAISILSDEPRTAMLTEAEAALGRALAALAAGDLDVQRLEQAAALLQGALRGGARHLAIRELAGLEATLGDVLWALGEDKGDDDRLLAAAEAKFAALARFEKLHELSAADTVREDLTALDRRLARAG
jgi:tetratricopeptide (TPR) repeat protein